MKISQEIIGNFNYIITLQVKSIPNTFDTTIVNTSTNVVNTSTNAVNTNTHTGYTNTSDNHTNAITTISKNLTTLNAPTITTRASLTLPKLPKLQVPKFGEKVTKRSAFRDL